MMDDRSSHTNPDLVAGITSPLLVGHRGANRHFPEHSIEGYRAVAAAGFPPEPDVRALADGTLVCIHDTDAARTMSGVQGDVASLTRAEWDTASIAPARPGLPSARPVSFSQVLDEFGGDVLLVPEIKVYDADTVTAFIDAIVSRGLERSVLVQSLDYDVAKRLAQAGLTTLLLIIDSHGLPASFASIRAAGIEYVGPSIPAAESVIGAAAREGLRSIVWTVNSRQMAQKLFEIGAFGVFSDDVWAIAGLPAPSSTGR